MKKLFLALASVLILSACNIKTADGPVDMKASPDFVVNNFEDCVAAGNLVMESYPEQCRHGDQVFVREIEGFPKPCTREYRPVCGKIQVQCIKAPCPPLDTTFSNRCEAENAEATDLREGTCEDQSEAPDADPEGACLSFDGKWLAESNECEGMPKEMCKKLGGTYNECASACRNDPEAVVCTLQCILVCQF